ncbi:hypothetical protein Q5P01_000176 [Channa striata]|uniref:Endonuclease/exonuclease/phosphatase domain-containing protein n=1 Tax=Channa striata TaxID=64152 RepID=A0AA88IFT2_CHASR|nr:hypothetical protein Q5P01_000176 [Channa striata]
MYSVLLRLTFMPLLTRTNLHLSSCSSTCSLLLLQISMSSANIIVQGDFCLTSSVNLSISIANKKGLKADPWCTTGPPAGPLHYVYRRLQRVYRETSLPCFTETWLYQDTPDSVVSVNRLTLMRADRTAAESGKKKGGGLAEFVNNSWCNPVHITVKRQLCSKDVELVAGSVRPYYLPREFSHVLAVTVYVPPSADAAAACERVHSTVSQLQTQHPQALILFSGDFNHACLPLSAALPNFIQYVNCHTRDNKTLDLLYANAKNAYTSTTKNVHCSV